MKIMKKLNNKGGQIKRGTEGGHQEKLPDDKKMERGHAGKTAAWFNHRACH